MARTIDEVKVDIDQGWIDLIALEAELAAIVNIQSIEVDLTKDLNTFLRKAEISFAENKRTYQSDYKSKEIEIRAKKSVMATFLSEARTVLFDANSVQYNHP